MKYNPKVNDFMYEHPKITLIGLGWAIFWRVYLVILGISLVFGLVGSLVA